MMGNAYEWCFEVFHSQRRRVSVWWRWYEDAYSARIGFRRSYGAHLRNKDQDSGSYGACTAAVRSKST